MRYFQVLVARKKASRGDESGLTLIEVAAAIGISIILAFVIVVAVTGLFSSAKNSIVVQTLSNVSTATNAYYTENGGSLSGLTQEVLSSQATGADFTTASIPTKDNQISYYILNGGPAPSGSPTGGSGGSGGGTCTTNCAVASAYIQGISPSGIILDASTIAPSGPILDTSTTAPIFAAFTMLDPAIQGWCVSVLDVFTDPSGGFPPTLTGPGVWWTIGSCTSTSTPTYSQNAPSIN